MNLRPFLSLAYAYELRDTQVRGLLLRVQPSGHKSWVVTWEHGKRPTLRSDWHLTLDEAREIAHKTVAAAAVEKLAA